MMAIGERSNAQTSRRGWKPRKTSDARLAKDIVESIKLHGEVGVVKSAWDYTSRIEIIEKVEKLLSR